MKHVDTSVFVVEAQDRIKPEEVDLGSLPPIQKPERKISPLEGNSQNEPSQPHTGLPSHRNTVTPEHHHSGVTSHRNTSTPEHQPSKKDERKRKKHGFVVFLDQIDSLEQIVVTQWQRTGKRPEVGEIVREGLEYIIVKKKQELGL